MRKKHSEEAHDEAILKYLSTHQGRSYSSRELARKMVIKKREFKQFRRVLRDLARKGIISQTEEGIFHWPASKKAPREKHSRKGERRGRESRNERMHREQRRDQVIVSKGHRSKEAEKREFGGEKVEGAIQQYRGGFAFLIPKDRDKEDIFIPPGALNGALDGDKVIVRIVRPQGQKKSRR